MRYKKIQDSHIYACNTRYDSSSSAFIQDLSFQGHKGIFSNLLTTIKCFLGTLFILVIFSITQISIFSPTYQLLDQFYSPKAFHPGSSNSLASKSSEGDTLQNEILDRRIRTLRLKMIFLQDDCEHTLFDLKVKFEDLASQHSKLESEKFSDEIESEDMDKFIASADILSLQFEQYARIKTDTINLLSAIGQCSTYLEHYKKSLTTDNKRKVLKDIQDCLYRLEHNFKDVRIEHSVRGHADSVQEQMEQAKAVIDRNRSTIDTTTATSITGNITDSDFTISESETQNETIEVVESPIQEKDQTESETLPATNSEKIEQIQQMDQKIAEQLDTLKNVQIESIGEV